MTRWNKHGVMRLLAQLAVLLTTMVVSASAVAAPATTAAEAPPPLREVVLLSSRQQFIRNGLPAPASPRIDASHAAAIPQDVADRILGPILGRPITIKLMGELREALQAWFQSIHRPFVSVDVPPQIIDSGTVQVIVLEARAGRVSVQGNNWFGANQYLDALHVQPGMTIDDAQLNDDIDWLNRNQYRQATIVALPGQAVGTTDLIVRTTEQSPFSVTGGVSNAGTKATNLYRLNTGFDWGNALWRGDDLNFNVSMSPDAYLFRQYALSYTSLLPWHDIFTIQGSLSTTHPPSGTLFGNTGFTGIVSLRYTHMLPPLSDYTHDIVLGYDFKSSNNNLLFGGSSIFDTTSEVDEFTLGYGGQHPDRLGNTSFELDLMLSPGGLTPDNTNAAFSAQQAGATANYAYAHVTADRLTSLPHGFSWDLRGSAQLSDAALLPSEQVLFGGYASVRGFEEQGATRDNGVLLENELRFPTVQTGVPQKLGIKSATDQLVPFLFLDFGAGQNHRDANGQGSWIALSSIGPGVTWQIARYLSSRFTWGIPLERYGHIGPLLGPQFAVQMTF